jgi:hypothetical protein
MSKECRTTLTDDLLAVVNAMRGGQSRSQFLAQAIRRGVRTIHAEAMKNRPGVLDDGTLGLGFAPLKQEGEATYFDHETGERVQALIDRLAY